MTLPLVTIACAGTTFRLGTLPCTHPAISHMTVRRWPGGSTSANIATPVKGDATRRPAEGLAGVFRHELHPAGYVRRSGPVADALLTYGESTAPPRRMRSTRCAAFGQALRPAAVLGSRHRRRSGTEGDQARSSAAPASRPCDAAARPFAAHPDDSACLSHSCQKGPCISRITRAGPRSSRAVSFGAFGAQQPIETDTQPWPLALSCQARSTR